MYFGYKFFKTFKKIIIKCAPFAYRMVLLLWIVFHVCILMFLNFLLLIFGSMKSKKKVSISKLKCSPPRIFT